MKNFVNYIPTKVIFGTGTFEKLCKEKLPGTKALVVISNGKSTRENGYLAELEKQLSHAGVSYCIFDKVEPNPLKSTVMAGASAAKENSCDFIVALGGGSVMDASKAIAAMAVNDGDLWDYVLFGTGKKFPFKNKALPIVAITTTAGTGSEVTQYAIVTLHAKRTKSSIAAHIFATVAFLDPKYMDTLPARTTNNTAVDALTHLGESYLSAKATAVSREIAKQGLLLFKECMPALRERVYSPETRDKLMLMSALGGVAIAQTMTSLPHGMGYFLTYEKGLPHGMANGVLTQAYLELFPAGDENVAKVLEYLGFASTDEMGTFLDAVLEHNSVYTEADVTSYTDRFMEQKGKLATFPYPLEREDIYNMYRKSLLK